MLNSRRSKIVASPNGHFFLKLVPSRWKKDPRNKSQRILTRHSYALAFEVLAGGQFKQLWSFKGWDKIGINRFFEPLNSTYYLCNDGMNLVKIIRGSISLKNNVVVMYLGGEEEKRYSPSDFGVTELKLGCPFKNWKSDIKRSHSYGPDPLLMDIFS